MSKKNEVVETVDAVEEVGQENNIQISIEQICVVPSSSAKPTSPSSPISSRSTCRPVIPRSAAR